MSDTKEEGLPKPTDEDKPTEEIMPQQNQPNSAGSVNPLVHDEALTHSGNVNATEPKAQMEAEVKAKTKAPATGDGTKVDQGSFVNSVENPVNSETQPQSLAKSEYDGPDWDKPAVENQNTKQSEAVVVSAEVGAGAKTVTPEAVMVSGEPSSAAKVETLQVSSSEGKADGEKVQNIQDEHGTAEVKGEQGMGNKENESGNELEQKVNETNVSAPLDNEKSNMKRSFLLDDEDDGNESGLEEEQAAFMKELENFFRERSMDFKPPKFYGEALNCLKLWRAVMKLGGYDRVTSCKLWRQVGESFRPPKTCTTVSWTFRGFYEKALLDYERHKTHGGELAVPIASQSAERSSENQGSGSGRARRDAAARAMQGWHSQRLLGNGEVSDPIIKDKNSLSLQRREKQLKNIGLMKRKSPPYVEQAVKASRTKSSNPQLDIAVVDVGPPANWVKINVLRAQDCFEIYALVPGLLREEVRVQTDPAGRLVISGEPDHPDNPWGVTPFKKIVSLPSRIDPHHTSAVVTLHGQLFVRVPFEQS